MDSRSPRSRSSEKSNHNMVSSGDSCNRPLRNKRGQSSSPTSSFVSRGELAKESKRVGKSRSLDRFQVLLYDIAEELDKDDLKSMTLLCYPHISKRQLNKIEVAEELFAKLCEKDIINDRNTVFLEKLLSHIGKKQLLQRVEAYHRANTADTDTMTEESESEILTKKRTSKRKRSLDSPDSATPQVQRKSMTKKQRRFTHSKLPDQDDEKFENCWKEKNVGNKRCLDEMMEDDSSDDSRSYWLRQELEGSIR
ncbi:uncharacterized protein [Ptychodera flava]|uniref:uncharacterized protein isoform X1 n=1 Tax=Ptychodera flava TaxID=63121 RepID=UPI00396A1FA6